MKQCATNRIEFTKLQGFDVFEKLPEEQMLKSYNEDFYTSLSKLNFISYIFGKLLNNRSSTYLIVSKLGINGFCGSLLNSITFKFLKSKN